jgi:hypothetical protein
MGDGLHGPQSAQALPLPFPTRCLNRPVDVVGSLPAESSPKPPKAVRKCELLDLRPTRPAGFLPVFGDDSITAQRELPELMAYR